VTNESLNSEINNLCKLSPSHVGNKYTYSNRLLAGYPSLSLKPRVLVKHSYYSSTVEIHWDMKDVTKF